MLSTYHMMLAVVTVGEIRGDNIMLNKPTIQSSTESTYWSSRANDGVFTGNPSFTLVEENPYWQGDLLGYYLVTSVTVTSHEQWAAVHLRKAFIGVSVNDVSCQGDEVVTCGQWPDETLYNNTMTFKCSQTVPVRFVRIWIEFTGYLALAEVEVDGTPSSLQVTYYERDVLKKLIMPTQSLTVASAPNCSTICHRIQPCLAFSFSPYQQPNCLLATDVAMETDTDWGSFNVRKCITMPNLSD